MLRSGLSVGFLLSASLVMQLAGMAARDINVLTHKLSETDISAPAVAL